MVLCIVTIHGIGFEQPPDDTNGVTGYADRLHQNLHDYYDNQAGGAPVLGDDPNRLPAGVRGPVYVESLWQPDAAARPSRQAGLSRLDDPTPLADGNAPVAHVALVYSNLEHPSAQDTGPNIGETADIAARTAFSLGQYASVSGIAQMIFQDVAGLFHHNPPPAGETPSLQPRATAPSKPLQDLRHLLHLGGNGAPQQGGGLFDSIRALEDDVATYVCRNDLRERVRGFVREALLHLCDRNDVDKIVINAHSQGTVVAYDVVRELPHVAAGKIQGIITAGSPLRKYVDFFAWGIEAGSVAAIGPWAGAPGDRAAGPWLNFYDDADPVADPLAPDWQWQRGTDLAAYADKQGLFVRNDPASGDTYRLPITDARVDNVRNSEGGGLQAHNYWDNMAEVIPALADFVKARA